MIILSNQENIFINSLSSENWADLKERLKKLPDETEIKVIISAFDALDQTITDENILKVVPFFKNPENHNPTVINKIRFDLFDLLQSEDINKNAICYFIL